MTISRTAKLTGSAAVMLGLLLGAAGIAGAASSQTTPPPVKDQQSTEVDSDAQDPSYTSSIVAPAEVPGQTEADESAALAPLAKITPEQATAAAQAVVPGDVIKVELENENGAVVYGVEIGKVDVKVDAGTGVVLHQDTGND